MSTYISISQTNTKTICPRMSTNETLIFFSHGRHRRHGDFDDDDNDDDDFLYETSVPWAPLCSFHVDHSWEQALTADSHIRNSPQGLLHIKDKLAANIWQDGKENDSILFFNSKSHQLYYIYYTKSGGIGLSQKTQMNTEILTMTMTMTYSHECPRMRH